MAIPQSTIFKKASAANFKSILKQQKKDESDPKFAISDSLQEYQAQLEKSAGYTSQMKLNKANIRQDIINFVIDYTVSDLDALKGMDYDEAKTQASTTEKSIKEFEGLYNKGVLNDEEIIYIKETVGKTNAELKKILGVATRLSLSFRDFKKELKPLKLAKRVGLTNVPIIGKKIERAIESEERAEARGLQMKRQLRRKTAKGDLKSGGGDTSAPQPDTGGTGDKEDIAKRATAKTMGMGDFLPGGGDSEEQVEQERESDKQFGESTSLLEKIYDESKLTNELLDGKKEDDKGFFEGIGSMLLPLAALTGLGSTITGAITGLGSTLAGSMRSMLGLPPKTPKTPKGPVGTTPSKTNPKPKVVTGSTTAAGSGQTDKDLKKNKVKTGNVVKNNLKKGAKVAGKVAGTAARIGGRVFLPLAAVMGIFDAAKGVAETGDLLDKEEGEELSFRDKASAGFAGFLSGMTFGLVDKKKTAKFLAGDGKDEELDIDNSLETRKSFRHGMVNNKAKLDKVEELKADSIEKLTIGDGNAGTTIVNNNIDSSNTQNKTEYGSTTIGSSNSDTSVKEMSNIG
tara:strand:- start:2341 stop:4053 length:1713 start_codon:yes stop_codon:yes gene_type:complete